MNIKPKKIKEFFKRLPRTLAENTFLTFFSLFVISLIMGGLVFYQYVILTERSAQMVVTEKILTFDQTTYQKILDEWKIRDIRISEIKSKTYHDPFEIAVSNQLTK